MNYAIFPLEYQVTKKGAGILLPPERRNLFIKTMEMDTTKYEVTTRAIFIFSPTILFA